MDESKKPNFPRTPKRPLLGEIKVLKFTNSLETIVEVPFCRQKLRDLLILKRTLLNRSKLRNAESIDRLMSLRKSCQSDVDVQKIWQNNPKNA